MRRMVRHRSPAIPASPSGATLMEVLMSLLIMSLGILPIFTLFPLCILSSIRATQLTNSRILTENVKDYVRTFPVLLTPPVDRTVTSWLPTGANALNWRGVWQARQTYAVNDVVMPPIRTGHLAPTPNALFRCTTAGTSDHWEPGWDVVGNTLDGGVQWAVINPATNPEFYNYVVDPAGRLASLATDRQLFGNRGGDPLAGPPTPVRRTNGYDTNRIMTSVPVNAIPALFTLADSRSVDLTAPTVNSTSSSVTLPGSIDLSGFSANSGVYLHNADFSRAVFRTLSAAPVGSQLQFDSATPLPGGFVPASVTLESFNARYTSFLVVRHNGFWSPPKISCVAMFNRDHAIASEHVYDANFGNSTYSHGRMAGGGINPDQVKIVWTTGTEPNPLLKEGAFVFDARAFRFYRISSVGSQTVNGADTSVVLTLERAVDVQTGPAAADLGRAMLIPGIIGIYDLQAAP